PGPDHSLVRRWMGIARGEHGRAFRAGRRPALTFALGLDPERPARHARDLAGRTGATALTSTGRACSNFPAVRGHASISGGRPPLSAANLSTVCPRRARDHVAPASPSRTQRYFRNISQAAATYPP